MKRKKYSIFVILYTIFNIGVLIGASDSISEAYRIQYNHEKEVNVDEVDEKVLVIEDTGGSQNKNENLAQNNAENEISNKEHEKNISRNTYESDESIDDYSKSVNTTSSSQSIKVFNVTADEIIEDLSVTEKAKILWVCTKLSKEEYKEIEKYLSYNNEKLGVMKVYEILEQKLDEDSIEEVKKIFSRYMDTEKVKEIYY